MTSFKSDNKAFPKNYDLFQLRYWIALSMPGFTLGVTSSPCWWSLDNIHITHQQNVISRRKIHIASGDSSNTVNLKLKISKHRMRVVVNKTEVIIQILYHVAIILFKVCSEGCMRCALLKWLQDNFHADRDVTQILTFWLH